MSDIDSAVQTCPWRVAVESAERPTEATPSYVTVKVGPEKLIYRLHRRLLCRHSGYFRLALGGEFAEAKSQTVELPHVEPIVFDAFDAWLYGEPLTHTFLHSLVDKYTTYEAEKASEDPLHVWSLVCSIWVLGDYLIAPCLKNDAIDIYVDLVAAIRGVCLTITPYIYDNSVPGAGLRRLLIDIVAHYKSDLTPLLGVASTKIDPQFMEDVMAAKEDIKRRGNVVVPALTLSKCLYHDHSSLEASRMDDAPPSVESVNE